MKRCIRFRPWHEWTKWERFEAQMVDDKGSETHKQDWQKRECRICGFIQEVEI